MYQARLPSKPESEITYALSSVPCRHASKATRLIVFINNLMMPAVSWGPCIAHLKKAQSPDSTIGSVQVLTYDRFGQGATTDRDPLDSQPGREAGYGHDFLDVVHDLHELVTVALSKHDELNGTQQAELFLVGASIGGPLARLYAQSYPGTVSALLILDSNICTRDYSDFWPNAASATADPRTVVAEDCTLDQYLTASAKLEAVFDKAVKNRECLDRRSGPDLLPHADNPILEGPGGKPTKIMVVGHDPVAFEEEGLRQMGTPKSLTRRFTQPAWNDYNAGLLEIGDVVGEKKVLIAKGCGHFIQKDDPEFVAQQIKRILAELDW